MPNNLINSTSKTALNPLAFQGIMVYTCYPQIRNMLLQKFGEQAANLFAEPVENTSNGEIDWYSSLQGTAFPFTKLSEENREVVQNRIIGLANDILNYAEELIASQESLKITRGNILKLALNYPDSSALYVIEHQPVLTCWGFEPGTSGVEGMYLTRLAPSLPSVATPNLPQAKPDSRTQIIPASAIPSPDENDNKKKAGKSLWWWLFPLFAGALLFLLLFSSFGDQAALSGKSIFHFNELPFQQTDFLINEKISQMNEEIKTVREKAQDHASHCTKTQQKQAHNPDVLATPEPEKLTLPKMAEDTSFLEGQWYCETGLANARTGEPVKVSFIFDKTGHGQGAIYEKDGICKGNATANLISDQLKIIVDELVCNNHTGSYSKITIDCFNANNGATTCSGVNPDGFRWDATFIKIR